jgi:tRNA (guanine-N7-)-methyltransferase
VKADRKRHSASFTDSGTAFPGRELSPERWTKTGHRDTGEPFDWDAVFGRAAPRIVDLGCGNGRFLIGAALARPDADHLGIDTLQVAIDHAAQRANRRGLANVRFAVGDAAAWMSDRFGPGSIDEVHIYHPQPYFGADAGARRLLTPAFLARTWEVLRRGGALVLQTDNRDYWTYLMDATRPRFEPVLLPPFWTDAPEGRTLREIQAREKGLRVWRMVARRRDVPGPETPVSVAFDANRPKFRKRPGRRGR